MSVPERCADFRYSWPREAPTTCTIAASRKAGRGKEGPRLLCAREERVGITCFSASAYMPVSGAKPHAPLLQSVKRKNNTTGLYEYTYYVDETEGRECTSGAGDGECTVSCCIKPNTSVLLYRTLKFMEGTLPCHMPEVTIFLCVCCQGGQTNVF